MAQMPGELPVVEVSVKVTDESGQPIEGALLEWGYFNSDDYGKGYTDENGVYAFTGVAYGSLGVDVNKEGYYESSGELWGGGSKRNPKPPESFTVELKKIVNPVPMYVKRVETELPKLNEPVGFDLEKGDWVKPYGDGLTSDIIFEGWQDVRSPRDFEATLDIVMTGELNGLHEFFTEVISYDVTSRLIPPHRAPKSGYRGEIAYREFHDAENDVDYEKEGRNYLFRVRTKKDASGRIVEARYGWIESGFDWRGTLKDTLKLKFTYYYNPGPDPENRSLEWSGENLFLKGMGERERRSLDHELREERAGGLSTVYPEISEDRRPKPLKSGDSR